MLYWAGLRLSSLTTIPTLIIDLYVVAVDLSGHGLSSHKPPGCSYNFHEYVMDVCRLVDRLGWKQFSIIGHSFGCTVGMMYAGLFPDRVKNIVAIDLYAPLHVPIERLGQDMAKSMSSYLHLEAKLAEPPTYTEEELLKKLDENTFHTLSKDSLKLMLKRDTTLLDDGRLVVNTDPMTKVISTVYIDSSYQYALMERYTGDLLMLTASQVDPRIMRQSMPVFFAMYARCCRRFEHVEVNGNHYVHMNHPERVAPVVNAFLAGNSAASAVIS